MEEPWEHGKLECCRSEDGNRKKVEAFAKSLPQCFLTMWDVDP